MTSKILEDILGNRNRTSNLKVVFVDVSSYSKRRSLTQAEVVDSFMEVLSYALNEVSQKYVKYAQDNDLNFSNDVICLPAGDGAAIVFPFDGLHDIHLQFAKDILKKVHEHNSSSQCEKFDVNGWCNCHNNFNLTVGVSEGKGIIYRDVNNNYNVAGNVINLAARVMGVAEKNQIMLSEEAYTQLVDMVDDPHLDEKFTSFHNVRIKHGLKISVYQYTDKECGFINCEPPGELEMAQQARDVATSMRNAGFPMPDMEQLADIDQKKMTNALKQMGAMFETAIDQSPLINEMKSIPSDNENMP